MKKYLLMTAALLAGPAMAADMPAKSAALNAYAAAPDNWTGLYVGIQGGYGMAKVEDGGYTYFDKSNWLAGGHVGYNYRMGNLVVGVETDAMLGGWTELGWIGSTALRVGVLLNEKLLAYGAAGTAYGRLDSKYADLSFTGWRAGAGLEYKLASHLSARAEYRYLDLAVASPLPHAKTHAVLGGISLSF